MGIRHWLRPPRQLLALFLFVTLIPAAALVWLGWHLLGQERMLARQRVQDWLDRSADLVAAGLRAEIAGLERALQAGGPLPAGAARVTLAETGVSSHAGTPLLFHPVVNSPAEPDATLFADWEKLEFSAGGLAGARRAYRAMADATRDPHLRAAALLRLARAARQGGDLPEAAAVYEQVALLRAGWFFGDPAELVARAARCELLDRLGNRDDLRRESAALTRDLESGRWSIARASYYTYADSLARWNGGARPGGPERIAVAEAISAFWAEMAPDLPMAGRRVVSAEGTAVMLLWSRGAGELRTIAVPITSLERSGDGQWRALRVTVSFIAPGGSPSPHDGEPAVMRTTAVTGLPWDVRVGAAGAPEDAAGSAAQRRALLAGLALLVFLIPAGGLVVARAVRKEMAVARLQRDFVSAVSHELRSPLTTLAHLTEMLSAGRVADEERRHEYYTVLQRETDRLRRFVEALLDFGRMEAGTLRYALDVQDAASLVTAIADEFRADSAARRHDVRVAAAPQLPPIRANRDALARALWNLLDNAAKYSTPDSPIDVEVVAENRGVAIRVRDHGSGIPPGEHARIFEQFARGSGAERAHATGAGVGLALARQVVAAHGGEICVKSEPGRGSTFSIVIPAAEGV